MKQLILELNRGDDINLYNKLMSLKEQNYQLYLKQCKQELLHQLEYKTSTNTLHEYLNAVYFMKDSDNNEYAYIRIFDREEKWMHINTVADSLKEHFILTQMYLETFKEKYNEIISSNNIEIKLI